MADPIPQSRTNYFRVKDLDAFIADLEAYDIDHGDWNTGSGVILDRGENNQPAGAIALFTYDFWPDLDEDSVASRLGVELEDEGTEVPQRHEAIEDLVAAHLIETDVAVFIGVCIEKMRYIDGYAVAVNARGEKRSVRLDDVYDLAGQIATEGTPVSRALY